jgi:hypothetical protein
MRAREVIADTFSSAVDPFCEDVDPSDFADELLRILAEYDLAIAPISPSEKMIEAWRKYQMVANEDAYLAFWRVMLKAAKDEDPQQPLERRGE